MGREQATTPITARTGELQREINARREAWPRLLKSRVHVLALVVWGVFVAVTSIGTLWARDQAMLSVGRIVEQTRTVRTPFEVMDSLATEQLKAAERLRAPRVYQEVEGVIDELSASIEGLPRAIQDVQKLDDVDASLREQFGLTSELLAAVKADLTDPKDLARWGDWASRLRTLLERNAFVDQQTFQVEVTAVSELVELRAKRSGVLREASINVRSIDSADLKQDMSAMAGLAGFHGPLQVLVTNRLVRQPRATYLFDAAATSANQQARAAAVAPVMITYPDRAVIFRRGDVLTGSQFEVYIKAAQAELAASAGWARRLEQASVIGVVIIVTLAIAGYTGIFCPRIRGNPARMAGVAAVMGGGLLVAWWTTATQPGLIALTSIAPTLFVGIMLAIAYDRRAALALGSLHGVLVCIGLDSGIGTFTVIVTGIGVAMWCLAEVRDRDSLIRTGLYCGLGLGAATFFVGLLSVPLSARFAPVAGAGGSQGWWAFFEQVLDDRALTQVSRDAGLAAFVGPLVAAVTLFILPSIERWFDITTGMTLVELRDPKNPLLRMLQQRAPGTYNHSLNLASLAEAAADAIGADSLLTYVGALYHDIGKMNKPEYFVENQTPGINKHDKLSPAMSLLIIVGHVKDGMELAREFGLPRPLWHFIESHHGTTLVEYFFHRAKKQAEREALIAGMGHLDVPGGLTTSVGAPTSGPAEIEYRYPGPKPHSKEAAIIMLCDAVESASRAMADPTPTRIDAAVRAIANKRLMDGQFDDCDLTLRDLNQIVEAVSKTLAAIYHGRIAYPTGPTARAIGGAPISPTARIGSSATISSGAGAGKTGASTLLVSPKRSAE